MEAKRRFVRTNNNIYEVVKETPCFFIVKDKRTYVDFHNENSTYRLPKSKVRKFGKDEYQESEDVRSMCDLFFRTYKDHTDWFGYPVIDIETHHPRIYQEQESQKRNKGRYTEINEFDWYGAIMYQDSKGRPYVRVVSKMDKTGNFELVEEDKVLVNPKYLY